MGSAVVSTGFLCLPVGAFWGQDPGLSGAWCAGTGRGKAERRGSGSLTHNLSQTSRSKCLVRLGRRHGLVEAWRKGDLELIGNRKEWAWEALRPISRCFPFENLTKNPSRDSQERVCSHRRGSAPRRPGLEEAGL